MSTQITEEHANQLRVVAGWENFTVDGRNRISVSGCAVTHFQMNTGGATWIKFDNRGHWFRVESEHLWLAKLAFSNKSRVNCIANPFNKNRSIITQFTVSSC